MRNLLKNLFHSMKPTKNSASSKPELLNLEARITPSLAQPYQIVLPTVLASQFTTGSLNAITAVGADSGGGPEVTITFPGVPQTNNVASYTSFFAYDVKFTGGVRVAMGDVNGDAVPDIITAAGPSGSPHIKVFTLDLANLTVNPIPISQFYAFNQPSFKGGVYVAAGDTNNDGFADVIVGAGETGGPRVEVYGGSATGVNTTAPLNNFFAYAPKYNGGVVVTAGQRNGNAGEEVIVAPASKAGYNIRSYDVNGLGNKPKLVDDFFAFNDFKSRGGLSIAAGNLDQGVGIDDLVVGTTNNQFGIILNNEPTGIPVTNVFPDYTGTIRAGVARSSDGLTVNGGSEVAVALVGPNGPPRATIFTFQTSGLVQTETALLTNPRFRGGLFGITSL